ncbi:VOC family protein [Arthrobacter sp. NPDC056727]|uniref:VOC family protein n=1 Tax=Arthrobacter sp. NPDC056727 TaxID=3345927 RepID=UPI003671DF31
MVQRSGYSLGELCWADVQTPDVAAAKAFYAAVFGWRYEDFPTPDGRSYAKAFLDDDLVATVAPQPQQGAPRPAHWNVYFAAVDAREAAAEAQHAGGTVQFGPEDIGDTGTMCSWTRRAAVPQASGRPERTRAAGGTTSPERSPGRSSSRPSRRPPSDFSSSCSDTR